MLKQQNINLHSYSSIIFISNRRFHTSKVCFHPLSDAAAPLLKAGIGLGATIPKSTLKNIGVDISQHTSPNTKNGFTGGKLIF